MSSAELSTVPDEVLAEWVISQRWFASKSREVGEVSVIDSITLRGGEQPLTAAFVQATFPAGTHELYQVLVAARPESGGELDGLIACVDGTALIDALADPDEGRGIAGLMKDGGSVTGRHGEVRFHWTGAEEPLGETPSVRTIGVEQSNSSIVFDDRLILKAFRRLEPGDNPELEMLRFLSARNFPNIAKLAGWYEFRGDPLYTTLGVLQDFVADGADGWGATLDDPEAVLPRLAELGGVVAELHNVLASDMNEADFAPEEPSLESLSLTTATIDEEIDREFFDLPHTEAVSAIANRGEEIRDRLQMLAHVGVGGKLIRTHGDLHLGQTLLTPDRWVLLDFEGEPARTLVERRRKRSPLRDVAGMLRSFAYAASAVKLLRGEEIAEDWEDRARKAFLEGYFGSVEPALMPAGQSAARSLLSIFELEKAVYELRYELNNRPDWVSIPVAGICRLLEEPIT